jgi:hypothetical protein
LHCEDDDEDLPPPKGIFPPPIFLLTHSAVSNDAERVMPVPESYHPLEGDTEEYCRFAGFDVAER